MGGFLVAGRRSVRKAAGCGIILLYGGYYYLSLYCKAAVFMQLVAGGAGNNAGGIIRHNKYGTV